MKKKKKNKNLLSKVFLFILNLIGILDLFLLIKLNVLPGKFLIPILTFLVIILIIVNFLLTRKKKKKRAIYGIAIIVISLLALCLYYLLGTVGFLNNFGGNTYKEEIYSIVVLKDSEYKKITDLENKSLGLVKEENEVQNKVLKKIDKKISIKKDYFNDSGALAYSLLEKKVDAILISNAILEVLYENIEDFEDKIKILYEETIKLEVKEKIEEIDVTKDFFNIYISGIDTYGSVNKTSRSDVNLILSVNPKSNQILITSIPRDYYVVLADKKGFKDKLTHAGIYGVDTSMKTIANLLNTEIDYYIKVNFSSLINVVDTLDGINVKSKYEFTSKDGITFKKGINYLNGKEALSFVRERKAFGNIGGDRVRGENQQIVLKALIEKALNPSILTKYNSLLKSVDNSFITNIPEKYITTLISQQLKNNNSWKIEMQNLDGTNGYEYTYSYQSQKLYVMIPDEESLSQAIERIRLLNN